MLLRGADDTIVKPAQLAAIRDLVPHAASAEVDGAAHAMLLTDPEKVAPPIVEFFTGSADSNL